MERGGSTGGVSIGEEAVVVMMGASGVDCSQEIDVTSAICSQLTGLPPGSPVLESARCAQREKSGRLLHGNIACTETHVIFISDKSDRGDSFAVRWDSIRAYSRAKPSGDEGRGICLVLFDGPVVFFMSFSTDTKLEKILKVIAGRIGSLPRADRTRLRPSP